MSFLFHLVLIPTIEHDPAGGCVTPLLTEPLLRSAGTSLCQTVYKGSHTHRLGLCALVGFVRVEVLFYL